MLDRRGVGNAAIKERIRQRRGDGGAEECAPLAEQLDYMLVGLCAVLDGVDTVLKGDAHALGGFDMGGDGVARFVSLVADRLDHLGRHFKLAGDAFFFGVEHAAGYHQLNDIDLLLLRLFKAGESLVNIVSSYRNGARHVAAGHGDALICGEDTGAVLAPRRYLVSEASVEICKAADGAYGRDAAEQLELRKGGDHFVCHSPGKPRAHYRLDELLVVALLLLRLAVACKMHMHIDESGHYVLALQIDLGVAVGHSLIRHDIDYLFAVGEDRQTLFGLHILCAVEEPAVHKCVFHIFSSLSLKAMNVL